MPFYIAALIRFQCCFFLSFALLKILRSSASHRRLLHPPSLNSCKSPFINISSLNKITNLTFMCNICKKKNVVAWQQTNITMHRVLHVKVMKSKHKRSPGQLGDALKKAVVHLCVTSQTHLNVRFK